MGRTSFLVRLLVALSALTLFLAACGGDDGDDTASGDNTSASDTASDDTGNDDDVDASDIFSGDCSAAFAEFVGVQSQLAAVTTDANALENVQEYFDELAGEAPEEIRDSFEVFAEEFGGIAEELADIGYTLGSQPTSEQAAQLAEVFEGLDNDALEEAATEIEAFFEDACAE